MKKGMITFLMALGAFTMSNAQELCNFETLSGTLGGWCDAAAVVVNPASGDLNSTDSTSMFTCTPTNWSAAEVTFEGAALGANTGVEFLVYVDNAGDGINLGELSFGGFSGLTDPATAVITESNTWIEMKYEIDGATSDAVINSIFTKVNGAGGEAINIYFDEIKLSDYTFTPAQNDPSEVVIAAYTANAMEIDGKDLEEDYDLAEWGNIDKWSMGEADGVEAEFGLLWDLNYLYMFIAITDPEVVMWDNDGFESWKGDGVQIYLDAMNRRYTGVANGITGASCNPGRESDEALAAGMYFQDDYGLNGCGGFKADLMQGSETSGSGYTLELAWSWKAIANNVMDSADVYDWVLNNVFNDYKFSFDFQLNNNTGGERVGVASWGAPEGPYGNSGAWGEVTLTGGPTSVDEGALVTELSVYPNPALNNITVELENMTNVAIYNVIGMQVADYTVEANVTNLNVSDIKPGVYVVKATNAAGQIAVSKVTIK